MEIVTAKIAWNYPMGPSTARGLSVHLSKNEKGNRFSYPSQLSAVLREVDPAGKILNQFISFEEHSNQVTMVQCSTSGDQVASGDKEGKFHIWHADHPTQISYMEIEKALRGPIRDCSFTDDGEKCAMVGHFQNGGDLFCGRGIGVKLKKTDKELFGHAGTALTCSYKANRPYKLYTGSEDNQIAVSAPTAYTIAKQSKIHKGWVNCIRVSPDNKYYISGGADKTLILHDANTDEPIKTLENAHGGSIYSFTWLEDSSKFVSASADKTLKVWSVPNLEVVATLKPRENPAVDDMQLGVVKVVGGLVSVSLDGTFNFWDTETFTRIVSGQSTDAHNLPSQRIFAHRDPIKILKKIGDKLITVDKSGRVLIFENEQSFPTTIVIGDDIVQGEVCAEGKLLVCGSGNTVYFVDLVGHKVSSKSTVNGNINDVKLGPGGTALAVTNNKLLSVVTPNAAVKEHTLPDVGTTLSFLASANHILVGTNGGSFLIVDATTGAVASQTPVSPASNSKVTCIKPSPNGNLIAVGVASGLLAFYDVAQAKFVSNDLKYHSLMVFCVGWNEDGTRCFSGSLDNTVRHWNTQDFKHLDKFERPDRQTVNCVEAVAGGFITCGSDGAIKRWVLSG